MARRAKKTRATKSRRLARKHLGRLVVDQGDVARQVLGFLDPDDQKALHSLTKATATSDLRKLFVSNASRVRLVEPQHCHAFEAKKAFVAPSAMKRVVCTPSIDRRSLHEYANLEELVVDGTILRTTTLWHPPLRFCSGLTSLSLRNLALNDPKLLALLTGLRKLKVVHCRCGSVDLANWSKLVDLQELHLEGRLVFENQLRLPRLRTLVVVRTGLFDLNRRVSDATLGSLDELRVHGDSAVTVATLAPAQQLRTLCLQQVVLTAAESLESLQALRTLSLVKVDRGGTGTARVSQLASLELLSLSVGLLRDWVHLDGFRGSLWFLHGEEADVCDADCSKVHMISVTNTIRDPKRFAQLAARAPQLRELDVGVLEDVMWVSSFVQLRLLRLYFEEDWVDLSPLRSLVNLETLALMGCTRETRLSLAPLRGLTRLLHVELQFVGVKDFEPLRKLTNLSTLDLFGASVSDVTLLVGLRHLEQLDVRNTNVKDMTPLVVLPRLRRLLVDEAVARATTAAAFPALQFLGQGDVSDAVEGIGCRCLETLPHV